MVKVDLPYVQVFHRKDRVYAYYRRGNARVPLKGKVGSYEWRQTYERVHADFERAAADAPADSPGITIGSFAALWRDYQLSGQCPEFRV